MKFYSILQALSVGIVLIPFLIGTINIKGLNRDSKWIYFYTVCNLTLSISNILSFDFYSWNYQIFAISDFVTMCGLFFTKFRKTSARVFFYVTAVFNWLNFLLNFLGVLNTTFLSFNINPYFNSITVMLWTLLLLKQERSADGLLLEQQDPFTWYLLGIILYQAIILYMAISFDYSWESETTRYTFKVYEDITILVWILYSIGLKKGKYLPLPRSNTVQNENR